MKNNTLKKITIILLILLVSLISFVGVYQRDLNRMVNIMPDYKVGMDLGEIREYRLDISQETETKYFDENGNETVAPASEEEQSNVTSREVAVNPESVLNSNNYELAKDIMIKRMELLGINEYQIRQDENGYIVIELQENDNADSYMGVVATTGKFEIKDSNTNEVLFSNNDVKTAESSARTESNGAATACLVVKLSKEAETKLKEISATYIENTDEEGNTETKDLTITLDGDTITTAHFGESTSTGDLQVLSTGELQIPIGQATSSQSVFSQYINEAELIARLLKIGNLPISYEIGYSNVFSSTIRKDVVYSMIIVVGVVIIIGIAFLIIKYNNGLLLGIAWVGFISSFLLILRFSNSIISINSIVSIVAICVLEFVFINAVLHNKFSRSYNEILKNYALIEIPIYITAIIFAFSSMTVISSLGIALFWGSIWMNLYNLVITKNLIEDK